MPETTSALGAPAAGAAGPKTTEPEMTEPEMTEPETAASADAAQAGPGVLTSCSFCLKPSTEVRKLVAGPGVFICDECVGLCAEIIAASPAALPGPPAWETAADLDAILASLPRIAAQGEQVERHLTVWVRRARTLGATWARIGQALGMTRQSAWGRFSGEE